MTTDLHTARTESVLEVRSAADLAALPADAPMSYPDEHRAWMRAHLDYLGRLTSAMSPAEQAAFVDAIRTDEQAAA